MSTTWRQELATTREEYWDTSPLVAVAPEEAVLDVPFDASYGGTNGRPVLIWTEERV